MRFAPRHLRILSLRWLLGLALLLASPPVQDLAHDVAVLVTGEAPDCGCDDGCDDSGQPCTQQCARCVCGARTVVAAAEVRVSPAPPGPRVALLPNPDERGLTGHTEPPFRPPAA